MGLQTLHILSEVVVASVPTTTSFTVTNAATGTWNTTTANGRTGLAIKLTPTTNWYDVQSAVSLYMADKIPAGVTLTILPPTYVPVYVDATLTIQDTYKQSDIKLAAYKALLGANGLFQYSKNVFGGSVPLSAVTTALQSIPGVVSTSVTKYNKDGGSTAADFTVSVNEILYLTSSNLVSTVTGGIA